MLNNCGNTYCLLICMLTEDEEAKDYYEGAGQPYHVPASEGTWFDPDWKEEEQVPLGGQGHDGTVSNIATPTQLPYGAAYTSPF